MKQDKNPFSTSVYNGPENFCDRIDETKQIQNFIHNGINITLFAIRRLGKTGLIQHVFQSYTNKPSTVCLYIDILATQNISEFSNLLATAIYSKFPPNKSLSKKLTEFVQLFRPIISFDELSGNPTLSLTITTPAQQNKTIQQLFTFLDSLNTKVVIAIDEFQQILEYPEKNTEAILRTHIQQLNNTSFIFCGSNQKMMHEIFNSSKRPFFASCSNIHLDFINETLYKEFIRDKFKEHNRSISDESLSFICEWTNLHTFYTQYFCNTLFATNNKKIELSHVHETAIHILKLNESVFYQYRNLLTDAQWKLLKAISKTGKLYKPNSKAFISEYNLGTPSLVSRGLEALLTKEMIFHNSTVDKPYYEVYDKFLMRWLQTH